MATLTHYLLSIPTTQPYSAANQHPFLTAARERILSSPRLALWLSQDRIYAAHAYPRFIGLLISKIPFSSHHSLESAEELSNQRILKALSYSLSNVVREAAFFRNTSEKWGLNLEGWKERKATRDYTAEMARVAVHGTLAEGLVFLWAMEKVYLDAWNYVQGRSPLEPNQSDAIASFVLNWTSPDFVAFVDELGSIVDSLAIEPGSEAWLRAEMIWDRVVELEACFWPVEGEESTARRL